MFGGYKFVSEERVKKDLDDTKPSPKVEDLIPEE